MRKLFLFASLVLCAVLVNVAEAKVRGGGGGGGNGATVYVNFDGDTTSTWGSFHPGTTPSAGYTAQQRADVLAFMQSKTDGIGDTDDGQNHPPLNVRFVDGSGPLVAGQSFMLVEGGTGGWLSSSPTGGISYVGSFNGGYEQKSFIFTAYMLGSATFTAEASLHEWGHALGLQHNSDGDGYVMDGQGGVYYGANAVYTVPEWNFMLSEVGTGTVVVPPIPEPSILWGLLGLGMMRRRRFTVH